MSSSGANPDPRSGAAGGASEERYDADVVGADVIGFSRFTQALVDSKGAGAAEEVRDALDAGFRAVADRLKSEGFAAVDSLGDGIILARPRSGVSDLSHLVRQTEQAFSAALGTLRVRAAYASGNLNLCRIGGFQQQWDVVATGAAIEALHAAIRRKRELEPVRSATDGVAVSSPRGASAREAAGRPISEIRRLAVAFVAIKPPASVLAAPLAVLQDIASLGQSLAEAWGGHLEKVTHDDKGFLFDFSFARTRDVGVTALDSALDFLLEIQPLLAERGFAPHCGLAEGLVYRGALTLGDRTIPIVHGPAVNLGAKLAASGETELALDWSAAQKLVARFRDFTLGVERTLPNGIRFVGFARDDAVRRPSAKPKAVGLVGRGGEVRLLAEATARLEDGSGGLIALTGPQGIGKTALATHLRDTVPSSINAFFLHADPRRASEHLWLWRDLARPLAMVLAGEDAGIAAALAATLSAAGIPDDLQAVIDDVIPASGLKTSARLDALEGLARRDVLERAIVALATTAARRVPTLLCLDDAHWFDEASLRVLAAVLQSAPELLVVLSYPGARNAVIDALRAAAVAERTQQIALEPLRRDDIKTIVRGASPILAQDDALLDQIFNLSGGNPFHAEQIAHLLRERITKSVAAMTRDLAEGPKMIGQVLDERLDGLSPAETQLVRTLSIFDRSIKAGALRTFAGAADATTLANLAAHAFVDIDDISQTVTMKNRMLIDAVIDRIPPREARALHATAARFTRRLRATKQDPTVTDAVIAHHWRAAGEGRRAAVAFGKAGDDLLYAGAPELAVRFFSSALAALPPSGAAKTSPRVAGWHAGLAVAHWAQGEMQEALADARNAVAVIDGRIGGPRWLPRRVRRSIARARRVLAAPTPLGKSLVPRDVRAPLVTVSAIRAEMSFFLGDIGAMASASASMIGFADEPRLRARARARAELFLGQFAAVLGLSTAAHAAWNRARTVGTAANDPIAASHGNLGEALWHMSNGRWQEARLQLEDAAALYAGIADPAYQKFVETMLALEAYFRGDWQVGAERFAALHALGVKQRNRSTEAWGLYGQAEALIVPDRWDDAEKLLAAAEPIVAAMPDLQSRIICKGLRAQIERGQRRHQRALDHALDGLAVARRLTVNNFGALEGFAAPAEVLLRLALAQDAPPFVRASAQANANAAMKALARFARVHAIAKPRLNLCQALSARLQHRASEHRARLDDGIGQATAMGMQFERRKLEDERSAKWSNDEATR